MRALLERGGDYVLAVKGNQKTLLEDIQLLLDDPDAVLDDVAQTVDGDHGRIETRRRKVLHDEAWLAERHGFSGLQDRYYLLSTPLSAARFSTSSRPLARREPSALGSRRRHGRGPGPRPQGPRTREPRPIAPLRAQHPPRQPGQRLHGSLLQNF
jgi:hypothetical protein